MKYVIKLNNGQNIPIIGLGTWQIPDDQVKTAVGTALDAGYRHIDTAHVYENEAAIGDVLQEYFKSGRLKREDVFITSKLNPTFMAKKDVKPAFEESLKKLQLDFIDLYLIHAPCGMKNRGDGDLFPKDEHGNAEWVHHDFLETWSEMEDLIDAGKVKSIGLSNFNSLQVDRIVEHGRIKPVTNQVECHIYLQQKELKEFCEKRGCTITAFSPFGSPGYVSMINEGGPKPIDDPFVSEIAARHNRPPSQILLRFLIQQGIIVIPKSVTPSRIKENFLIFDFQLTKDEMDKLAEQDTKLRFLRMQELKDHPEFPFHALY